MQMLLAFQTHHCRGEKRQHPPHRVRHHRTGLTLAVHHSGLGDVMMSVVFWLLGRLSAVVVPTSIFAVSPTAGIEVLMYWIGLVGIYHSN